MKTINLKDYYDHIEMDTYIDVPNEVFEIFEEQSKEEQAYQRKKYRNNAHYSLDAGDGIEHCVLFRSLSPNEIYERKLTKEQLYTAIATLPNKQWGRIYAHFFLGISKADIAKTEGVSEKAVRVAIERGLKNMERILKNLF